MFLPNSIGKLYKRTGSDLHGRPVWAAGKDTQFAPIDLSVRAQKTSVRADSSASRGAADEQVGLNTKILVVRYSPIGIGDKFEFLGRLYIVVTVHPRMSVMGALDHYECDLEVLP